MSTVASRRRHKRERKRLKQRALNNIAVSMEAKILKAGGNVLADEIARWDFPKMTNSSNLAPPSMSFSIGKYRDQR